MTCLGLVRSDEGNDPSKACTPQRVAHTGCAPWSQAYQLFLCTPELSICTARELLIPPSLLSHPPTPPKHTPQALQNLGWHTHSHLASPTTLRHTLCCNK